MNKIISKFFLMSYIVFSTVSVYSQTSFCDDFESYANGSYLAASSNNWTTWSGAAGQDVQITNSLSNSGSNAIYLSSNIGSSGGPEDIVLPFGSGTPYVNGDFKFSANFYVTSGAYFNFQAENTPGITWALDVGMDNGVINFGSYAGSSWISTYLSTSYPSNQWFELSIEIDLSANSWEVFIDSISQGTFSNPVNKVASLDLYPLAGHGFYVDDICYSYTPSIVNPCLSNEKEIIISITTDNYPLETSWQLVDQNGGGFAINPGALTLTNTTYTWSICVPDTNCYDFTIYDTYGDGICCNYGNGSYFVTYSGNTVANGGSFGSSEMTSNIGSCSPSNPCLANEIEVVISITTDNFPSETYWQLVDQNGSGWYINPGALTQSNTTYLWTLCVPDTNCYDFTIYDTYGDGLCCLWGSGYYSVSYGGNTVATGASFGSSETTANIGLCIPISPCPVNEVEITITINTDDYPTETSWFLIDQYGGGWTNVPLTVNDANTTLVWSICVPDTNCYSFTILDSYGDGICCSWGNGSYFVTYDGVQVSNGGVFNYAEETCGIGYCTPNCQIQIPQAAILEGEPCGTDANRGCDDNWKISNFTIQSVTDDCSWGYAGNWPPCFSGGASEFYPDLYVYMAFNNNYFYYSDYYLDTWYPNSFSMYANQPTSIPLEIQTQNLLTSPYVNGQTYSYEFSVYDDDDGLFQQIGFNSDDYIGSYTLPQFTNAGTFSITTSGGGYGNANVDYTTIAPSNTYTTLSNNNVIHGTFWAQDNTRDTDWYEFILSDSSDFQLHSIAEVPCNVMLLDASSGCSNTSVIDSIYSQKCDTIVMQQSLSAGTYWLVVFPSVYSCLPCSDSAEYLLDVQWTDCDLSIAAIATNANCNGSNANIDVTTTGGLGPFTYQWNTGDITEDLIGVSAGNYHITVYDNKGCFDTLSIVIDSGTLIHDFYSSAYVMGFELNQDFSGWHIQDANNDGHSWSINQFNGSNNSYGALYNYNPNGITSADDWLFSQCFVLDSSETYLLSFKNRVASALFSEDMEVYLGTQQDAQNMNTQLMQLYNMTNVIYDSTSILFNVSLPGIYYIGWHAMSNANMWRIDLDDINLSIFNQIPGCTDSTAMNYDSSATFDDGSCIYAVYGCTDPNALNYNPLANIDDGSCIPVIYGCTDSTAINYYPGANVDDGSCMYTLFGCTDPNALNYNPTALIDDGSCIYPVYGCMDSTALNYNPLATIHDSSCIYPVYGCMDSTALNYNPLANVNDSSCIYPVYGCMDSTALNYNPLANVNDSSCIYPVYGCMDSTALNYNPNAIFDDSSCVYCVYGCMDSTALNYDSLATCDDGSCIPVIYGCTDSTAINYYPGANINDGSCCYIAGCTDSTANNYNPNACFEDGSCDYCVYGCTGPTSCNYNALATCDDGSCWGLAGCTDSTAINYNSMANCNNGSCVYLSGCVEPIPTGVYAYDIINERAKIGWNNMNSSTCMVDRYRIRYREVGATAWLSKTMQGSGLCIFGLNTTVKQMLNLTHSTTYEYKMKAWYCGGTLFGTGWSATQTFTTQGICPDITNLTVTPNPNNNTRATFCWDTTGTYLYARIKYRVDTSGSSWINVGGFGVYYPTTCKVKFGMTPGENYKATGRAFCDPNMSAYNSNWTPFITWTQPGSIRQEGGSLISNLEIYPNPSRDIFNVSFTSEDVQDLEVRVINVVGEVVYTEDLTQFVGEYTKAVDLETYSKGIYFLEITTNSGVVNKKLILQ